MPDGDFTVAQPAITLANIGSVKQRKKPSLIAENYQSKPLLANLFSFVMLRR
jgi:hypothetical protein